MPRWFRIWGFGVAYSFLYIYGLKKQGQHGTLARAIDEMTQRICVHVPTRYLPIAWPWIMQMISHLTREWRHWIKIPFCSMVHLDLTLISAHRSLINLPVFWIVKVLSLLLVEICNCYAMWPQRCDFLLSSLDHTFHGWELLSNKLSSPCLVFFYLIVFNVILHKTGTVSQMEIIACLGCRLYL